MSPSQVALRLASVPAALGLLVADALLRPDPAAACSIAAVHEHEIDADDPDVVPPDTVSLVSVEVAELGEEGGCGSANSCDGIGTISIIVAADDDTTAPDSIGFTIELVSGSLPPGLNLPDGPVRGSDRGDGTIDLVLVWSPEQADSLDFIVRLSAVDAAGNIGEPVEASVAFEGDESGCAAGRRPRPGAWPLGALAVLFVLRSLRRGRAGRSAARRRVTIGP